MNDHKTLIKNSKIGEFEIDLSQIYFKENRAIQNQWVTLINSEKNFEESHGFLKFSCSVVNG